LSVGTGEATLFGGDDQDLGTTITIEDTTIILTDSATRTNTFMGTTVVNMRRGSINADGDSLHALVRDSVQLYFSDMTWVFTGSGYTRFFELDNYPNVVVQHKRCTIDMSGATYVGGAFIRLDADVQYGDGSGFFACVIIEGNNLFGLVRFNVNNPTTVDIGYKFEQTTFLQNGNNPIVVLLSNVNTVIDFYQCHFSEAGNLLDGGACTTTRCSFFNSDQASTTNTAPIIVTTEGFVDRDGPVYDLSIDPANSDMFEAGGVPLSTSNRDRLNRPFNATTASTGAYEGLAA
jgi:hypothetical protein